MTQKAMTFHSNDAQDGLTDKRSGKNGSLNYLLFLPEGYGADPEKKWPLIMFLHGAGERGNDPRALKRHGIPKIVERQPDFPFIAVSPQCSNNTWWQSYIGMLDALLDEVMNACAVDADRVYLTGVSMGGAGVWLLGSLYPERFAALAPICGYGSPSLGFPKKVCALKDVPVWAFHGAKDDIVPLEATSVLVDTLKSCGGDVRFTIYPDAGHDSWTETYDNPALYGWFLSHARRKGQ